MSKLFIKLKLPVAVQQLVLCEAQQKEWCCVFVGHDEFQASVLLFLKQDNDGL